MLLGILSTSVLFCLSTKFVLVGDGAERADENSQLCFLALWHRTSVLTRNVAMQVCMLLTGGENFPMF